MIRFGIRTSDGKGEETMETMAVLKMAGLVAVLAAGGLAATAAAAAGGPASRPATRPSGGALRLPAVFSDNMVIQRDAATPIWGWAGAGSKVTVEVDLGAPGGLPRRGAGSSELRQLKAVCVSADDRGRWSALLPALPAGGPYTIAVSAEATLAIRNVLAGEVWLCSGQSNMEWALKKSTGGAEAAAAADHPLIRYFRVEKRSLRKPADDVKGEWVVCSPKTAGSFAGVAYHFGRALHEKLAVPVGLIDNSWSGAQAEALLPMETIGEHPGLAYRIEKWEQCRREYARALEENAAGEAEWKKLADAAKAAGKPDPPGRPRRGKDPNGPETTLAGLYNGMVSGLVPYAVRGVAFYQGENNVLNPEEYKVVFPLLIRTWRALWANRDLPFLFVQIANFGEPSAEPSDTMWSRLRDAQLVGLGEPGTAMVVTIDVGGEFHALNKRPVGERLALAARTVAYGEKGLTHSGPLFARARFEGGKAVVTFRHAGGALAARGGEELRGFALAGEDRNFVRAEAKIAGADRDRVEVSAAAVAKPLAVRYAWGVNPVCNLVNDANLPASPFRSDDWPPDSAKP